ncbi:MAG TPA: hypothetical protein VN043_17745 [Rhodanobacter sp.]|nr:hypothetical protein [Rhodanobacter sp.]
MNHRRVFCTTHLAGARAAMIAAQANGIADDCISLIAREDIELEKIPDHRQQPKDDATPAALRGAAYGGSTGLLLGLVAVAVPPLGVTLAGAVAATAAGTVFGGWIGQMIGFDVPDAVSRKFKDEIEAGRILVIIDGSEEQLAVAEPAIVATGATQLPFDAHAALN